MPRATIKQLVPSTRRGVLRNQRKNECKRFGTKYKASWFSQTGTPMPVHMTNPDPDFAKPFDPKLR